MTLLSTEKCFTQNNTEVNKIRKVIKKYDVRERKYRGDGIESKDRGKKRRWGERGYACASLYKARKKEFNDWACVTLDITGEYNVIDTEILSKKSLKF